MIAFTQFGVPPWGRLGNQLFQYVFLRRTAARLGTKFYIPSWQGDGLFDLHDSALRADSPSGLVLKYQEPWENCGFNPEALEIKDGADITGYFQSERYFGDREEILEWFSFKKEIAGAPLPAGIDIGSAASLSLRIDDDYNEKRDLYPLYPLSYYERALAVLGPAVKHVLIFSDRPDRARRFFFGLKRKDAVFIEGLKDHEQLRLQSLCRFNVITNSTFSWWGAYLNRVPGRRILCPESWFRPGHLTRNPDIICKGWETLKVSALPFSVWRIKNKAAGTLRSESGKVKALFQKFMPGKS